MSARIRALKLSLLSKLGALLCVLAGILLYSGHVVNGLIQSGRKEAEIINATGRQRMLVQQFVRQANLALIGISTSDWETLLEQRRLSAKTSEQFERSMHALLEGGEVVLGKERMVLPKAEAEDVRAKLLEIQAAWEEVKSASVKVLRSNNSQLRDHPDLQVMQSAASRLVARADEAVSLMQQHSISRSEQLARFQSGISIGGLLTFALLGFFVKHSIIDPLAHTIVRLDASEEQHRNLYESAPVALWKAMLPEGKLIKINGAMERLAALGSVENPPEYYSIFAFFPHTGAHKLLHTLQESGQLNEIEMEFTSLDGQKRTVLVSARYFSESGFAEGAVVDITSLKQAQAELARMNSEMVDLSRRAGMAEVATNVLHNVGNVLNSVNVSCTILADMVRQSKVASVKKTAKLLKEHQDDLAEFFTTDPKGKLLPAFFETLSQKLEEEQVRLLAEIKDLDENIDHINDIIIVQQGYARVSGVTEIVQMGDLVDDAYRMNAPALDRHQITVTRDYQENLPQITVEKHKVLQILVNLIRNAKHALVDGGKDDRQLTLRVYGTHDTVTVDVIDNGIGIAEENLTRVFSHGFTTKKDGHGFGLHSGALSARELGGHLGADSRGLGRGARFTLTLPVRVKSPVY